MRKLKDFYLLKFTWKLKGLKLYKMSKPNDSIVGNLRFRSNIKLKSNETLLLVRKAISTVCVTGTIARKMTLVMGGIEIYQY